MLDFYCPFVRLAIEVDGGQHNTEKNRIKDERRTKCLEDYNINVIRFWNSDIFEDLGGILNAIMVKIEQIKSE